MNLISISRLPNYCDYRIIKKKFSQISEIDLHLGLRWQTKKA